MNGLVFPTPVGVFPPPFWAFWRVPGLPHARGGVSNADDAKASAYTSSPRPWGCFFVGGAQRDSEWVFPTPVGVFPKLSTAVLQSSSLPHTRGLATLHDVRWKR